MDFQTPIDSSIQAGYSHPLLRKWQSIESSINPFNFIYPVFVNDKNDQVIENKSFPEQFSWSLDRLNELLDPLINLSLKSVLLFGVLSDSHKKDNVGSWADDENGPVVKAIKFIKKNYPQLFVIADVCLCQYTSTGSCGIIKDSQIDNVLTVQRIAQIAMSYANAGADMVAQSDMNDGSVAAIKDELKKNGLLTRIPIMSYSAKFASALYGPFRNCVQSQPLLNDRSKSQLPIGSSKLAIRALLRDSKDGADILMVKPALFYLDIISEAKKRTNLPIAAFQVSGEYSTLWYASKAGVYNLKSIVLESIYAIRRAGADLVITYFAPKILEWLRDEDCV